MVTRMPVAWWWLPVQEDGIWTHVPRYTFEGMDFDVTN